MKRENLKLLLRPVILIAVIALLFSIVRTFDLVEQFDELRTWISSLGPWGPFVYVALFLAGILATFPTPVLKIGAIVLFGPWKAAIIIIVSITLGSSLSFIVSRYLARDSIARLLSRREKFRKLDNLTKKYGAAIVLIARLVQFIPFNLQNYGFGLTKVKFRTYVLLTFVGMIPNTIFYTAVTDAFIDKFEEGHIRWAIVVLAAVTLIFMTIAAYFARRYLKDND